MDAFRSTQVVRSLMVLDKAPSAGERLPTARLGTAPDARVYRLGDFTFPLEMTNQISSVLDCTPAHWTWAGIARIDTDRERCCGVDAAVRAWQTGERSAWL